MSKAAAEVSSRMLYLAAQWQIDTLSPEEICVELDFRDERSRRLYVCSAIANN